MWTDTIDMSATSIPHPAKYSDKLLPIFAEHLSGFKRVLDPFAGTGKLREIRPDAFLVELEPEWATCIVGDALQLPFADSTFDAICTSPCLAPDHKILTADLRWICSGDIKVGEQVIAFDEFPSGLKPNNQPYRRKYRIAKVIASYGAKKECVIVHLENGESITCTVDHPWLANRYNYKTTAFEWIRADKLMTLYDPHICKQFDVWASEQNYNAGWLAGMFDGEGSLSWGVHGAPKLLIAQRQGAILDQTQSIATQLGFKTSLYSKNDGSDGMTLYFNGGIPDIVKVIGSLRPTRLVQKFNNLDLGTRSIEPERVRVVAVESIGMHEIAGITTSTGTYIGEGYLMHNTYGNRMADHFTDHQPEKCYICHTYTHVLGRKLSCNNSGAMQWGEEYRNFHIKAWRECFRILRPHGRLILNISDHIRAGEQQFVSVWHLGMLRYIGFTLLDWIEVPTPRNRMGQNGNARVDFENVFVMERAGSSGLHARVQDHVKNSILEPLPHPNQESQSHGLRIIRTHFPRESRLFPGGGANVMKSKGLSK